MKKWLANLAVMAVAAAIPCGVAEVVLRITAPPADTPELFRKLPTPVEWSGRPHARGIYTGVPVAFNALGLRDAERSPQPAPGTIRILALGDSVTFGMGVTHDQTYPRQTEALLNAARGPHAPPVEVLNMGMPGYNTLHQLAQLRELGLALQPRVVVLGFLYNDVEQSSAQKEAGGTPKAKQSLLRETQSRVNAATLWLKKNSLFFAWLTPRLGMVLRPLGFKGFGQIGEVKDQYVDSNPHWRRVRDALLEMKRLTAERGVELVVMIVPAMAQFDDATYPIKEYHQAVATFCRENGIRVLDLLPAFWGLDGTRLWIHATDGHPNAEGQRIIARSLAEFLAPLIQENYAGMKRAALRRHAAPEK
jgi:lysophospholipase L1-like esterase